MSRLQKVKNTARKTTRDDKNRLEVNSPPLKKTNITESEELLATSHPPPPPIAQRHHAIHTTGQHGNEIGKISYHKLNCITDH